MRLLSPATARSLRLLKLCGMLLVLAMPASASAAPPAAPALAKASARTSAMASLASAQTSGKMPAPRASAKSPLTGGKKKLLLFAKNPATWSIVTGGASGKLVFREAIGDFTFKAAELNPRSPYALVRYAAGPPRAEIVARGSSDGRGGLALSGVWRNWSEKFCLVSGEDVAGSVGGAGTLRAWRPERYLFEEKPLGVPCACPEPEEP